MIDRYTTPEMARLWSEAHRYQSWLEVELAATEAWEALGEVPFGTAQRIREKRSRAESVQQPVPAGVSLPGGCLAGARGVPQGPAGPGDR